MQKTLSEALLFSGSSHPKLAEKIAVELGVKLGKLAIERFPDGETSVQVLESVRGKDVFVVQTIALDPNNFLMELLILIDAFKRASARSIVAVIPYFGYCRQDRKDKPRVPITAKLVANLLEKAGATRVLTMELHAGQLQGFFDIPVDNLSGRSVLVEGLQKLEKESLQSKKFVVVTPDVGSIKLARSYAGPLELDYAIVDKHRINAKSVEVVQVIGDVKGKNVLLADDMCSTGGTLVSAAKACQEKGALEIYAAVTHGIFVGDAVEKINLSPINTVFCTDTIPVGPRLDGFYKLQTVSTAPLFAEAIRCVMSCENLQSQYLE